MSDGMQQLAEQIQKASPIVWQAALRQVHIETYELVFFALILPVASYVLFRYAKSVPKDSYEELEIKAFASYIGSALTGLIFFPVVGTLFEYLMNPTYAAIKELKGIL